MQLVKLLNNGIKMHFKHAFIGFNPRCKWTMGTELWLARLCVWVLLISRIAGALTWRTESETPDGHCQRLIVGIQKRMM